MFTVKHYRRSGSLQVTACDGYELHPNEPNMVLLQKRAEGYVRLEFEPDESVFIENLHGKTITALRPKRPD